jgi:WD40 repeat protein
MKPSPVGVLLIPLLLAATARADDKPAARPSPLDKLDGSLVPADEKKWFFDPPPKEVVAVLRRPNWSASGATFSPDGKWLAAWDANDAPLEAPGRVPPLLLWDTADLGRDPTRLGGHKRGLWAAAFSADGKRLAAGSRDTTARVWDLRGESPAAGPVLEGHKGWVLAVAFAPDGKTLAAAAGVGDGAVWLWDLGRDPPAVRAKLEGYKCVTQSAVFSPDGKRLAFADFGGDKVRKNAVRVWDLAGEKPREWAAIETDPREEPGQVAFSPDGKRLFAAGWGPNDPPVRVWDVTGDRPAAAAGLKSGRTLSNLALAPDGKRVAAAGSGVVVWDAGGKELHRWPQFDNARGVTFAPDGRHLAVIDKSAVYVLRLPR